MPFSTRTFARAAWCIAMLPAVVFANPVEWEHPNWAKPAAPFKGRYKSDTATDLWYRIGSTQPAKAATEPYAADPAWSTFTIPPPSTPPDGPLTFWLGDETGGEGGAKETVPYADHQSFYVSGHTGIDIPYSMPEWGLFLIFKPCCFIDGGLLDVFKLPRAPHEGPGLPKVPLSPYFSIEPDDLTTATAGLRAELHFQDPQAAEVVVLQWIDDAWVEASNVEIDTAARVARFRCVKGGLFVAAARENAPADSPPPDSD